jgi:hypothetical protein
MTPEDLTKLQISQSHRDFHQRALWEEVKHFTGLVSLIFSASMLALINEKLGEIMRGIVVMVLSVGGIGISAIGLTVLRRESVYFEEANRTWLPLHKVAFPEVKLRAYARGEGEMKPEDVNRSVRDEDVNKPVRELITDLRRDHLSVRGSFQLLFWFFLSLFAATLIVGMVYSCVGMHRTNSTAERHAPGV